MIFISKWYCERQFDLMQEIPPQWVEEYQRECDQSIHPSWFYLHLSRIYMFAFLWLGCTLGVLADSMFLGGTIVDYNKTLEMEIDD